MTVLRQAISGYNQQFIERLSVADHRTRNLLKRIVKMQRQAQPCCYKVTSQRMCGPRRVQSRHRLNNVDTQNRSKSRVRPMLSRSCSGMNECVHGFPLKRTFSRSEVPRTAGVYFEKSRFRGSGFFRGGSKKSFALNAV